MDTLKFLDTVLPPHGLRCLTKISDGQAANHILNTNRELVSRANWLDYTQGEEVYFALGSLKEPFVLKEGKTKKYKRIRSNVSHLKCFWLDIDCGKHLKTGKLKDYASQKEGLTALFEFVKQASLPTPLVINSGYGLHVYFVLKTSLPLETWEPIAHLLHLVVHVLELKVDDSRTRDGTSVLRLPGMRNKKDPEALKTVKCLSDSYSAISPLDFVKALKKLLKDKGVTSTKYASPEQRATAYLVGSVSQALNERASSPPPLAHSLAKECAVVRHFKDAKGNVSEPLWYALIGLLRHTEEGLEIIQEWSSGHPDYSPEETGAKVEQHVAQDIGPTTCAFFKSNSESNVHCSKCSLTLTSPIQIGSGKVTVPQKKGLGSTEALRSTDGVEEVHSLVKDIYASKDIGMYQLAPGGVIFKGSFLPGDSVSDEEKEVVLDYPLIVKASAEDERRGGVVEIQCKHPCKGLHTFYLEKSALAEKITFSKQMFKNHVVMASSKTDLLRSYVIEYLRELDKTAELTMLYTTMGWKGDIPSGFVLGTRFLRKNKPVKTAELGIHLEHSPCKYLEPVGDLSQWTAATELLDQPGMQRHALSLCMGFGAPLFRFTGFDGASVSLWGRTNSGKSTMLQWLTSIYGKYSQLKAQEDDTAVSLMSKLGALGSLPLVIDEVTNMEEKDISRFIHSISQGREKTRMTKAVTDRPPNKWNTLVITSSNVALADKLQAAKGDPEAERLRLFEYFLSAVPVFEEACSSYLHTTLQDNYGVAGAPYIQYLLDNLEEVKALLKEVQETIIKESKALGKERFWVATVAVAITGGLIAQKQGLIRFDMKAVQEEAVALLMIMRGDTVADKIAFVPILGRYLNAHVQHVLYVHYFTSGGKEVPSEYFSPHRDLCIRIEGRSKGQRVFVDKSHLLKWLSLQNISASEFLKETKVKGLLLHVNKGNVLGEGWANNPSSVAVPSMEFYLPLQGTTSQVIDIDKFKADKNPPIIAKRTLVD